MYVLRLKNILIIFIIIFTTIVGVISYNSNKTEVISNKNYSKVIVVDAGHGLPDGGATSYDIVESDLNLQVSLKLYDELESRGYKVIMTRKDENNIAGEDNQSASIAKMKAQDLNNRVKIINESNADFCISIHMNKFENPKYWGWQTFYNKNSEDGKKLANLIQNNISKVIDKNNKRTSLSIDGIKIVDKTNIPVVIVECGFISNEEEAKLLQSEEYRLKLVQGIANGIEEFYD